MSIEVTPEIDVDSLQDVDANEYLKRFSQSADDSPTLVTVTGSVGSWEKVKETLFALRSANISPILHLKADTELDDEEIVFLFSFLRDWDQLFLHNFLEICGDWVPKEFQAALQNESKIELKWVSEWLTANSDQRIYKYPGLPWRSFVRKIVGENYDFAMVFMMLAASAATDENVKSMHDHIKAFLEIKKKVVCVFPKRWGKLQ